MRSTEHRVDYIDECPVVQLCVHAWHHIFSVLPKKKEKKGGTFQALRADLQALNTTYEHSSSHSSSLLSSLAALHCPPSISVTTLLRSNTLCGFYQLFIYLYFPQSLCLHFHKGFFCPYEQANSYQMFQCFSIFEGNVTPPPPPHTHFCPAKIKWC